jgi:RNA polymerase sigma factor (sigma-70 family)
VSQNALPPFEYQIEKHGRALLAFCIVHAGRRHGEDVFQETMLAALRAYDTVRDPAAVKSWLFSIAARKAIDAHRSTARTPEPTDAVDDIADPMTAPERASEAWDLVAELPEKQRNAVALRFLGGLSHREIAAAMQTSEAAARRNVFEAIKRLRTNLPHLAPTKEPS